MEGTDFIYAGDNDLRISTSPDGINTRTQSNKYQEIIDDSIKRIGRNHLASNDVYAPVGTEVRANTEGLLLLLVRDISDLGLTATYYDKETGQVFTGSHLSMVKANGKVFLPGGSDSYYRDAIGSKPDSPNLFHQLSL